MKAILIAPRVRDAACAILSFPASVETVNQRRPVHVQDGFRLFHEPGCRQSPEPTPDAVALDQQSQERYGSLVWRVTSDRQARLTYHCR